MSQKKLIRYKLDEDTFITIESDLEENQENNGIAVISDNNEEVVEVDQRFEDVISTLAPVSNKLLAVLKDVNKPDEIQLEMGLKLGVKAGLVFASADTEGAFKVSLKWTNPKN